MPMIMTSGHCKQMISASSRPDVSRSSSGSESAVSDEVLFRVPPVGRRLWRRWSQACRPGRVARRGQPVWGPLPRFQDRVGDVGRDTSQLAPLGQATSTSSTREAAPGRT
jgi:hypothetical protein